MKPVFIIAIVFSITIALVGVVAMTNTVDDTSAARTVADKAVESKTVESKAVKAESVESKAVKAESVEAESKYNAALSECIEEAEAAADKAAADKAEAEAAAEKAEAEAVEAESKYNAALSEYTVVGGKAGVDAKVIEAAASKLAEAKVVADKARSAADLQTEHHLPWVSWLADEAESNVALAKAAITSEDIASYNVNHQAGACPKIIVSAERPDFDVLTMEADRFCFNNPHHGWCTGISNDIPPNK